ncbi:sulfotransferase [Longispora albida]|uniref:sulfotransferase n=1 Tax=Longispora albida TaxID=203523 RepID=UPI000371413F|nr:sulfotransferase [Longispora albida]
MVRLIFIGALGRSGTTLLERVLGQLPGVCALGEVVHLWDRDVRDDERCGCGHRFSRCEFWQEIGERAFGGWHRLNVPKLLELRATVERTRHIPRLAVRGGSAVEDYVWHYRRVYQAAAEVSGAPVIVDSSKHAALAYCLRWSPDIDLRVLHVVRDARGVAYSWTKNVPRPETDGTEAMTRYSPTRSALLWNTHNAAFGLLRRSGVPVRRVRYENFLRDPVAVTSSIARFAGLGGLDAAGLGFLDLESAELTTCHSAAGNPMRFTTGRVPLRRDEAWRTALPPRQRQLVGALTAPLLSRYGYLRS